MSNARSKVTTAKGRSKRNVPEREVKITETSTSIKVEDNGDDLSFLDAPENHDGWEDVTKNDITPFWDFKENGKLVGVLLGKGKTVGEGTRATRTYLFEVNGDRYLVPQWAMLNELDGVPGGEFEYQIKHFGTGESKDGNRFTRLEVKRRPVYRKGARK